jgi:hypothetical protein
VEVCCPCVSVVDAHVEVGRGAKAVASAAVAIPRTLFFGRTEMGVAMPVPERPSPVPCVQPCLAMRANPLPYRIDEDSADNGCSRCDDKAAGANAWSVGKSGPNNGPRGTNGSAGPAGGRYVR